MILRLILSGCQAFIAHATPPRTAVAVATRADGLF